MNISSHSQKPPEGQSLTESIYQRRKNPWTWPSQRVSIQLKNLLEQLKFPDGIIGKKIYITEFGQELEKWPIGIFEM